MTGRMGPEAGPDQAVRLDQRPRLTRTYLKNPSMAKPNYAFEKRQRDLAKKRKKEEKRLKKARASESQQPETQPESTPLPPIEDKPPS